MFTCIGRRVSLLRAFQRAAGQLDLKALFYGTDTNPASAALQLCDQACRVRPASHRRYIPDLLALVKDLGIDLLVPTVDLDLKPLANHRHRFADLGCHVLVSRPKVIEICQDKRKTHDFLVQQGFDTPRTLSARSLLPSRARQPLGYPCYIKPWDGYAGRFNVLVENRQELEFYGRTIPHALCQAFIVGDEYTCDVYVDGQGKVRCVVPRLRLEVRAGEVSKARVVKDPLIMETVQRVVEALGAGPGVITVQLIKTEKGQLNIIEINPRFGGGAPLSIRAGANFPKWILQELIGREPKIRPTGFKDDLVMLRYDSEVWGSAQEMGI